MSNVPKIVIIPAGGVGSRVGYDIPKQYIKLSNNKTILDTTISKFLETDIIDEIYVIISQKDNYYISSEYINHDKIIWLQEGGSTRFRTIFNALNKIANIYNISFNPWVFVHDAARPYIHKSNILKLYNKVVLSKSQCGILALKSFDTIKLVNNNHISKTLDRNQIWLAQTPQMARFNTLIESFNYCISAHLENKITDESSALEYYNQSPIVVEGSKSNFKITTPEDI